MSLTKRLDVPLLLSTAFPLVLLIVRNTYLTGCWLTQMNHWTDWLYCAQATLLFLVWNLWLALLPWVFAQAFVYTRPRVWRWLWLALWLLFLPNAPYLVTDLVHLRPRSEVPFEFDIVLFFSFAWAGLLLGARSLWWVGHGLRQILPSHLVSGVLLASVLLSGCGVYIGRYLRWNSWDALYQPILVLQDSVPALLSWRAGFIVVGYAVLLGMTYWLLHTTSQLQTSQPYTKD